MHRRWWTPAVFLLGSLLLSACGGGGGNSEPATPAAQEPTPPTTPSPAPPTGDDPVFPTSEWVSATPADMNMDVAKLNQARDYSLTGGGSGFITRKGRRVYSWGNTTALYDLKSATKSVGGMALGLALDDGLLRLGDSAQMHLSTLGVPPTSNRNTGWLSQITIVELATHTAGFEKPGGYVPLQFQPGTTWFYSDGGLNWLADVLTQVYGEDLNSLLFSRVWSTIGITDAAASSNGSLQWRSNAFRDDKLNGVKRREFGSGISASVDAMARIGYLFLRRGMWDGQRLLPESFVDAVHTPRPEVAKMDNPQVAEYPTATANYGMMWWTNTTGELPDVPRDTFWAWGLGDSLIVVIPSLDLVIARTGNNPDDPSLPQLRTERNGDYKVLAPLLTPIVQSVSGD
ncbi:MAG TPA: serine hydrolase [Steroidobacteraceae bacterium]|nr:serine hydrolase [Steroidobacteraceae bacterium]